MNNNFDTMVLIDCGRAFYKVEQIYAIIDVMHDCRYKYLMLGFGNDGLRFLLDDMSIIANGKKYDDRIIREAIISCNNRLSPDSPGQYNELDMNKIFDYACQKNISIIPMLDIPGHATAISESLLKSGIADGACLNMTGKSGLVHKNNISISIESEAGKEFSIALIDKYISYFSAKGIKYFNFGCDEYGGDSVTLSTEIYNKISDFIFVLCNHLPKDVKPLCFTDVLTKSSYYNDEIIGINWIGGSLDNHKMINAHSGWYYVLGSEDENWAGYDLALKNTAKIPVTEMIKDSSMPVGSILAVWNDNYLPADKYMNNIFEIIKSQSKNNSDYF